MVLPMPATKTMVLYGERGGAYKMRSGQSDENGEPEATARAYLSKDGKDNNQQAVSDYTKTGSGVPILNQRGQVQSADSYKTVHGGSAPPGYGEHPAELDLWQTPEFSIHPLTQRLEAISGLFFRLWPEHVRILQKMKIEGWPHIEIVVVAKELKKRQEEQYQRDEQLAQQHLAMAQQAKEQEAAEIHGYNPEDAAAMMGGPPGGGPPMGGPPMGGPPMGGPPEGGPPEGGPPGGGPPMGGPPMGGPPMGGPPMGGPPGGDESGPEGASLMRGISTLDGDDYYQALENFRGKFYSRDCAHGLGRSLDFRRNARMSDKKDKKLSRGFGIIIKTMFDGDDPTTVKERRIAKDRSFTTRESGILNGPPTEEKNPVLPQE